MKIRASEKYFTGLPPFFPSCLKDGTGSLDFELAVWIWSNCRYKAFCAGHENTLINTYVMNKFLTADRSCTTRYFCKNLYRSWLLTALCFFLHLLRPNWSIFRGTVSLWKNIWKRVSKEYDVDFRFIDILVILTSIWQIRKRTLCIKKHLFLMLQEVLDKIHLCHFTIARLWLLDFLNETISF